jgi:hypothetical protein
MKRRNFLKSSAIAATSLVSGSMMAQGKSGLAGETAEYYDFRIYTEANTRKLGKYLKDALIPALKRYGVEKVGVFKEYSQETPSKIYVIICYSSIEDYLTIPQKIKGDAEYKKAAASYDKLTSKEKVFDRINTSFLKSFSGHPTLILPPKEHNFFELRTYESHNEDAAQRKVKMFNSGEIDLFTATGLNVVFFGELLAGDCCPALSYMVSFKDLAERDANWKVFGSSEGWKKMRAMDEYKDTVSRINRNFLLRESYSQL